MIVLPAIDLRSGHCVRLAQGRKEAAKVYDTDPVKVALGFEDDGAEMLHLVDLDGAFGEPHDRNREVVREIIDAIKVPVQFGGGLGRPDDVSAMIDIGVQRVLIGSIAVESPEILAKLIARFAATAIVVGIDAKGGRVATRGWESSTAVDSLTLAHRMAAIGVDRSEEHTSELQSHSFISYAV